MRQEEIIKKLNLIKKYLTAGNPIWDVREIDEALDMAIKALEELPKRRKEAKRWKCKALQAELVKHGEWKKSTKNLMACSECGTCYLDDSVRDYLFCPNCGAKMNGGKE